MVAGMLCKSDKPFNNNIVIVIYSLDWTLEIHGAANTKQIQEIAL